MKFLHFVFLSFFTSLVLGAEGSRPPNTAVGNQFLRWLDVFNNGDDATLVAYHEDSFPYSAARGNLRDVKQERLLRDHGGGYQYVSTESADEYSLTAILQEVGGRGTYMTCDVRVDRSPPHHIAKFSIRFINTPSRFLSPEERTERHVGADLRAAVVADLASTLEDNYAIKSAGEEMATMLRSNWEKGYYDGIDDASDLAAALSKAIRTLHDDTHMHFAYYRYVSEPRGERDHAREQKEMMEMIARMNYGFGDTKWHPNGIASIQIRHFFDLSCFNTSTEIANRMSSVADAKALIIDLREAHGGCETTMAHIAAFLLGDKGTHLSTRYSASGTSDELWTDPAVQGDKFGPTKPLYILTSEFTGDAAEVLAYALQALKRATIVGERTKGEACRAIALGTVPHFLAVVPTSRQINPITGTNWEDTGVIPDIRARGNLALDEALARASAALGVTAEPSQSKGHENAAEKVLGFYERVEDL